jgi:hypothetical protein
VSVTFGWKQPTFVIELQYDGDFLFTLHANTTWPLGTQVELRFHRTPDPRDDTDPIIWPATVSGTDVTWEVDNDMVREVLDAGAEYPRLRYAAEGRTIAWMRGSVDAS